MAALPESVQQHLLAATAAFDAQFSRFKPDSEVCSFRHRAAGTYELSPELTLLLRQADHLRQLTHGGYDPALGGLLELAGYDPEYSLHAQPELIANWQLPQWELHPTENRVTISGPLVFDIGGMGKGYWIDRMSDLLFEHGYAFHLVEGGGDMFGTTKQDGSPWRVALELPGQPDMALGTVDLTSQGFAASDTFKRRWGNWNHLLQASSKQPVKHLLGCSALAPNAWLADQLTAVLPHLPTEEYAVAARDLQAEYVVLTEKGELHVSAHWPGQFFHSENA